MTRNIDHYNLDAVISVGYRVNSIRATQFRRWATQVLAQYAKTGYVIDRKRMENGAFLDEDCFERLLDLAESAARRHIPMTMEDWAGRIDRFLLADDRDILKDAGKISMEIAKSHAESEFEKYRIVQGRLYTSDFDKLEAEGDFHE